MLVICKDNTETHGQQNIKFGWNLCHETEQTLHSIKNLPLTLILLTWRIW